MTRTAAVLSVLLLALLGGCAGAPGTGDRASDSTPSVVRPSEVSADHNDTDLSYVDRMYSQHQQAIDMVAMTANKDLSPELAKLAARVGEDRSEEMKALQGMARAWGVPPHPPDYHGNPGELTMEQLSELYDLDGAAFEQSWTQRMTDNHLGAVAMSKAELDDGLNLGTREFARGLVRLLESQVAELEGR